MSGTILGFPFSGVVTGDNGSIAAEPGDGSTANGNARGANAVDWQTVRAVATQVASGLTSGVLSGNGNTASADNAVVSGGTLNQATGVASWSPGGRASSTRGLFSMGAWASGGFSGAAGEAQREEHVLRRQTTDATATRLTADNAVAAAANTINLSNFSAIAGRLVVRARAAGGANLSASWFIDVSATRDNGAGTVLIEGGGGTAIAPTHSRGTGSAWRIDITADTTNGGIAVTVTGAGATTINWTAAFIAVQVATTN